MPLDIEFIRRRSTVISESYLIRVTHWRSIQVMPDREYKSPPWLSFADVYILLYLLYFFNSVFVFYIYSIKFEQYFHYFCLTLYFSMYNYNIKDEPYRGINRLITTPDETCEASCSKLGRAASKKDAFIQPAVKIRRLHTWQR